MQSNQKNRGSEQDQIAGGVSLKASEALQTRALRSLVGGVNSPVRSFRRVGGHPIFVERADGPHLWDKDGNRYIDFVMSYGPHLFGHNPVEIQEAIRNTIPRSTCYGMTSENEVIWAELFLKRVPFAEKVRAVSTGTEATATAIRLARGITGRDLVVKFSGHYHGHVDSLLVDAGSGMATHSDEAVPECAGIPKALAALARVVPFNAPPQLEEVFKKDGHRIAALILEPVVGNMGVIPPQPGFLELCRKLCDQAGALLIFDEVMCGLRIHRESTMGLFGVRPDLGCYGKIVGGGVPMAAVAGPSRWMDSLSPLGGVYQAGTLSGNPISIAAGIAMMNLIDQQNPYQLLEEFGSWFEKEFYRHAKSVGISIRVERVGSMMSVFFRDKPVWSAEDSRNSDHDMFTKFFWKMIENGIMLPPSPYEAFFLSIPHTTLDRNDLSQRIERVFQALVQS